MTLLFVTLLFQISKESLKKAMEALVKKLNNDDEDRPKEKEQLQAKGRLAANARDKKLSAHTDRLKVKTGLTKCIDGEEPQEDFGGFNVDKSSDEEQDHLTTAHTNTKKRNEKKEGGKCWEQEANASNKMDESASW